MKKLFVILLLSGLFAQAQPPTKFFTRWGGNGHDVGYGVVQTYEGQYAVTGSTGSFGFGNTDVYLGLVDSMGWLRWEKSFGGFNNDIGQSIIQVPSDSGFVIAGYTNSLGNGGYDLYILRTDKNGNKIWEKTFGGMDWDFGYCVKQSADGGFVVCGKTFSFGYGKSDGYIVKVDANGIYQWSKTYGGAEEDEFKSFVLTYNGYMAFAGTTKSMGDVKGDCWVFKTLTNGDSTTSFKYGNSNKQIIHDITEHPVTHNFIMCGGHDVLGKDSTSAFILGLSETGTFLFEDYHTYHELKDEEYVTMVHLINDDHVYSRKNVHFPGAGRGLEPMIGLYSNNNYIATTTYGSPEDEELFDVIKTRDGGAAFVGYTKGYGGSLSDIFLLKLDASSIFGAVDAVGFSELKTEKPLSMRVYPSVSSNFVNLESTIEKNYQLIIYNSLGETVLSKYFFQNTKIDISLFTAGVYFFEIDGKDTVTRQKIIKN
jgi:hypothetical protein